MPTRWTPPDAGGSFLDTRGDDRAMRVSWHLEDGVEDGVVVLSLWHAEVCTGTFRLPVEEVAELVGVLSTGLGAAVSLSRAG